MDALYDPGGWAGCLPPCSPETKEGYAIHMYVANTSMHDCCFCNADGDLLIVPQQGARMRMPCLSQLHMLARGGLSAPPWLA